MTQRNEVGGALGGLNGGNARDAQDIPFFCRARGHHGKRLGQLLIVKH